MGRRRKPPVGKRQATDPEAILTGREEVDAEALFRLIHRVNPTGRDLEARRERQLYDQKARLQSLLVRRFSELLVVEATDREEVVSLRHRSGALDACHAVVDDLEPDARSWVRRQLDLAVSPQVPEAALTVPAVTGEVDAEPSDALVARAERAVADYEYDVADACLVRALEQSGGAPEAALPLLELRVELLGMDAEALAVEERLGARAREHPRIRSLLAAAAARCGAGQRALDLVRGLPPSQGAEVYAVLTHSAVQRRDLEAAERFLAETGLAEPPHPRLEELRREVAELVAANVRPAEEELAERYRQDGAPAVEAEARALLARWSESAVARRILHEATEVKRRRDIAEALEHAEEALDAERFRAAERYFRAALEAGSERTDLEERAADARRRAEERDDETSLAAVVRAFDGGDERAAHRAYLVLPEHLRQRARQATGRPSLDWLEEAGAPPSGQRAHHAVAAVQALELAAGHDDPQAIVDELAPHLKTLQPIATANRLLEDAQRRLADARRRRARAALERARRSLDEGSVDDAARCLAEVDAGELDAAGRSLLAELRERQNRAAAYARLVAEYERCEAEGEPLAARDRALELVEAAAGEVVRRHWQNEVAHQRQEIRAHWAVEVDREARPLSDLRDFRPSVLYVNNEVWLDDEGGEMILADLKGFWLFIRVVDARRERLVERVSLRPRYLTSSITVWREGDVVRVADENGGFLEMARDGWEVLREIDLRSLTPSRMFFRDVIPTPGSPHAWCELSNLGSERLIDDSTRVLDLESMRFVRRPAARPKAVLLRPEGPQVVCQDEDIRIFSARGIEVPQWRLLKGLDLSPAPGDSVFPPCSPEGDSLLSAEKGLAESMLLRLLRPGGGEGEALKIPRCRYHEGKLLATQLGGELGFVLFRNPEGGTELVAVAIPRQGGDSEGDIAPPEELYRVPFAWDAAFVQDRWGYHLQAVQLAADHLRLVPLGPSAPAQRSVGPSLGPPDASRVPAFQGPHPCEVATPLDLRQVFVDMGYETPKQQESFHARLEVDPYGFVSGLLHGRQSRDDEELEEILRQALERCRGARPDSGNETPSLALRYALAVLACDEGRWDDVRDGLSGVDPARIDAGLQRHYHHLLGLSLLAEGRWREARESFAEGRIIEGGVCGFTRLFELTEVLEAGELTDEERGVGRPLIWQLWGAMQAAERALVADDPAAAVAQLDRPAVWSAREAQSAARLAAAWLEIEPETPAQLFEKRQALAFFYEVHNEQGVEEQEMSDFDLLDVNLISGPKRRCLDVSPLAWDRARLDELAGQAITWLASQLSA